MRNKFIQKSYGKCLFYCLANLFNDESIVDNGKNEGYFVDARKVVESKSEHTLMSAGLAFIGKSEPLRNPLHLTDNIVKGNYYCAYIANVDGMVNGTLHSILVLLDCEDLSVLVFDPIYEGGYKIHNAVDFLKQKNVYELDVIASSEHGGKICLPKEDLKHLFI